MSSDNESLKKDPIGPQEAPALGSYEEFLSRKRGCLVAVDYVLKQIPEARSATRNELVEIFRREHPGARWGVETICRNARKIQNDWGQYRADDTTQTIRNEEERNWRKWAVETTSPPLPTTTPVTANTPRASEADDETSEREANAAWTAIAAQFEKYRQTFGDKEALLKIAQNIDSYEKRFGAADRGVLEHALGEAACSAIEEK